MLFGTVAPSYVAPVPCRRVPRMDETCFGRFCGEVAHAVLSGCDFVKKKVNPVLAGRGSYEEEKGVPFMILTVCLSTQPSDRHRLSFCCVLARAYGAKRVSRLMWYCTCLFRPSNDGRFSPLDGLLYFRLWTV